MYTLTLQSTQQPTASSPTDPFNFRESKITLLTAIAIAMAFTHSYAQKCTEIFNPKNRFCYGGVIYDKCGGKEYAPKTHHCSGTAIKKNNSGIGTFTDARDGKSYKTVGIGQIWMAENLNYEVEGSVCYDNSDSNCDTYGRLYNWETAMKACPKGWHLPSDSEWQTLVNLAGGDVAGTKLKAKRGWSNNGNGTDEFGFSALPGGYGSSDGSFFNVGDYGLWWSAYEFSSNYAYHRGMYYNDEGADWYNIGKADLFSVRCVQD